jgi:hypothetical protein
MDIFDSQGRILSIGSADQGIVSKKITDKDGQGQAPKYQPQKKVAMVQLPEKEGGDTETKDHVIDITV